MAPVASKLCDKSAPSLLWAHEIRRENAHLVKELDKAKATLAAAVSATTTAQKSIIELQRAVLELKNENQRLNEKLDQVENGQHGVVNAMKMVRIYNKTMEVEVTINGKVLDFVEKVARGEIEKYMEEMMNETSESGISDKNNIQGSDSVSEKSVDEASSQSGHQHSAQELSSTPSPSSWSQESTVILRSCQSEQKAQAVRVEKKMSQNEKNKARSVRKTSPSRAINGKEAQVVSAKKQVSQNEKNKGKIVQKISLGKVISGQEAQAVSAEKQVPQNEKNKARSVRKTSPSRAINGKQAQAVSAEKQVSQNEKNKGKRVRNTKVTGEPKAKKRRFIPIVPPDEEDMSLSL
ncbi:hypothetical protein PHISCL_00819 [Aspergillus sclerotialis]|uniref:Uncharacterized protein n=1 Tax=Aspergillus sclerotialis TaxID=2070753 RepID=A0A3A3A505_9EURO|nr:hypothetical protein PHISCL_00819 [Aspergillus sclerotialis]